MFSRVARLTIFVAIAVGTATPAVGQDRRELARRVSVNRALGDSSSRVLHLLVLDETVRHAYTDTLMIMGGSVRLLTTAELRPVVAAAAVRTDSLLLKTYAPVTELLRGRTFTIRMDTSWRRLDGSMFIVISSYTEQTGELYGGAFGGGDAESIATGLANKLEQEVVARGSKVFSKWLPGPAPLDNLMPWAWANVRLELISAEAVAGRRCFAGDRVACKWILGLEPADDPATTLFDSTGRAYYVGERKYEARRSNALATDRCLRGSDSACVTVARAMFVVNGALSSLPQVLRSTLAREAFRMGGPGAIVRLVQSPDSIGPAIAAAAGVPLDSVIGVWQRHLREEGIGSEDLTLGIAALSIGWTMVLGLLSLRSGRWR